MTSDVTLYTTPGCSACAAVKRYLDARGVSYNEKDVSQNEAWVDEMKRVSGGGIAPVTVVGDRAFYGTFEQQRPQLETALALWKGPTMNNVITRTLVLLAASTAFVLVMAFALPPAPTTLASTNQEHTEGHDTSEPHHVTVDSEEAFIAGMVPHHQEAVDSSEIILGVTERPEVRSFAQNIIATQNAEIDTLTGWLEQFYPDAQAAAYTPMMESLEGLSPEEDDRTFLEGMIVHHQGAVQMAQSYLTGSFEKRPEVADMAEAIVSAQEGEISQMRGWLSDWYGDADAGGGTDDGAEHGGH